MTPTGRARIDQDVVDLSVLVETGLKGINAVLGITERGIIGKTVLVGSWNEYVRHFGGILPTEVSEFPQYCKRTLDRGGKLRIARVAHYTDIDDKTTLTGTEASITLTTGEDTLDFTANSIGEWGNGLKVVVATAKNGAVGEVDVTVSLAGYPDLTQTVTNLKAIPTEEDIAKFNMQSLLVVLTSNGGTLTVGTHELTGGVFDESTITTTDYVGSSVAGNGIYSFDDDVDFVKIAVPEKAVPEIDTALIAYAELRKDCRAVLRTPVGISGTTAIEYRERTGLFEGGVVPNTWYADMFFGGLRVNHAKTGAEVVLHAIGDVLGAMSLRDSRNSEWFAVAGSKRGRINAIGVDYNLASPSRSTEFDQVSNMGINAIVDDKDFQTVIWDNVTLWKGATLLRHSNVADLVVYLNRAISPLAKSELFEPNDIETWKAVYRRVRPLLELVKSRRGIWDYVYQGDQLIDNIEDAVVNTGTTIDAGQYVFNLFIKPKVAMKYLGVRVIVANSGVSFEEIIEEASF